MIRLISVLIAGLLFINPAFSMHHKSCDHHGKFKEMMKGLELSDAQKAEIKKIMQSRRDFKQANRQKMRDLHMKLKELSTQENYDAAKVSELINQKTALMAEIMKMRMESKHKIYSMLSPEQKEKYKAMKEKLKEHYMKCKKKP